MELLINVCRLYLVSDCSLLLIFRNESEPFRDVVIDDVDTSQEIGLCDEAAGFSQSLILMQVLEKDGDDITEYADGQDSITPKRCAD